MLECRLDEALVNRGLVESRNKAKALIELGRVLLNGKTELKSSKKVKLADELLIEKSFKFVSRAGEKLEGFLANLGIEVNGKNCIDVGASTGGFTDCLLQRGAAHVTCVDVGSSQLHQSLIQNPKIVNFEGIHAKNLEEVELPYKFYDIAVIDVSFISLTQILISVWKRVDNGGILIALIKPQFEAGKEIMQKNKGVIKDPEVINAILEKIRHFTQENLLNAEIFAEAKSVLPGVEGNIEYLIGLKRKA